MQSTLDVYVCQSARSKSRLAKKTKFVYDGRVRKIILFLVFFLSSALIFSFFSPGKALAACEVSVDPISVVKNYDDNISLTSKDTSCFGIGVEYKIIAYPRGKQIKDLNKPLTTSAFSTPVIANKVSSGNGKELNGHLNFNDENSLGVNFLKPHDIGQWRILVCDSKTLLNDCDNLKNIVAQGQFSVQPITPTPTPTPQQDQPNILRTNQDTCTFQVSYDPSSIITIRVENVNPSQTKYSFWTDWDKNKIPVNQFLIPPPTPSISNIPSPSPSPTPIYSLKIAKSFGVPPKNKHPLQEEGHLFCIDAEGKDRTGSNCLRLFFTAGVPQGNTACSEANSGIVSPTPNPHLPPCANWVYKNGDPIPKEPTQEEFIRQNNIRDSIKCTSVQTGIGEISTEPQGFVKRIFSFVLGIAGGIALILIMISGYKLMASQGNPEQITAARDQLISAIVGLLFIIFSFVILEIIGVDILKIPGFTK